MAKRTSYTETDTTALPQATSAGMDSYKNSLGKVSLNDMLMSYNGSKSGLAQALAGTSDKSSTAYKSQMKNISRWTNGERNPERSGLTQSRFKTLYVQSNPPTSATVNITGWIGYDEKYYYRTISTTLPARGVTVSQFVNQIQAGNIQGAYNTVFASYGVGGGVLRVANDNPAISITFS